MQTAVLVNEDPVDQAALGFGRREALGECTDEGLCEAAHRSGPWTPDPDPSTPRPISPRPAYQPRDRKTPYDGAQVAAWVPVTP